MRYVLHFAIAFALGIYLSVVYNEYVSALTGIAVSVLSALFVYYYIRNRRLAFSARSLISNKGLTCDISTHKVYYIIIYPLILAGILVGLYYPIYYNNPATHDIRRQIGKRITVEGTVVDLPWITSTNLSIGYKVDVTGFYNRENEYMPACGRMIIYLPLPRDENEVVPKEFEGITARITPSEPSRERFIGGFNYSFYLKMQNIYSIAYAREMKITAPFQSVNPISRLGITIRKSILNIIGENFKDTFTNRYDNDIAAMLTAIMVGDRSEFSDDLELYISRMGLSHITSISGMHIVLLFGLIMNLSVFMRMNRFAASASALAILIVFMSVSAYTPSVIRAVIMMALIVLAGMLKRNHDSLTNVAISSIVILTINPYLLFSAAFILSFTATGALIIFTPYLNKLLIPMCKIPIIGNNLRNSLAVSMSTSLGTTIFSAYFFKIVPLWSFVFNFLVLWSMVYIFTFGYLYWILTLMNIGFLAVAVKWAVTLMLMFILEISYFFGRFKFLFFNISPPTTLEFVIYAIMLVALYYYLEVRYGGTNIYYGQEKALFFKTEKPVQH